MAAPSPAPKPPVLIVLWISFLTTQLIFGGVGWFLATQGAPPQPPNEPLMWILAGLGCATPGVAPMVTRMVIAEPVRKVRDGTQAQKNAAVYPGLIVGFALREAGAIFAFMILFMWQDPIWWAVPAGVAFASTLVAAPTAVRIEGLIDSSGPRRLG